MPSKQILKELLLVLLVIVLSFGTVSMILYSKSPLDTDSGD